MESYIYLIRNKDLYTIGISNNLDNAQSQLKPGKLVAFMKSNDTKTICKKLYARYSQERIPKSEYFRLNASQVTDCKQMMKEAGGRDFFLPIFRGGTLVLTFLLAWLVFAGIIIKFGVDPIFDRFT
ncbi:GIY-YIG nuclease family protein [Prochlorococcus marinus]|uniref:Uncharacterized protein n=1 Tax=Prochlorococcus marinus (strain MIT 9211) TaxID=93059 RepID=A9B9U8_PROM4|nr:GIY-YIG nuclease family protein [Prochlorococcus marinus]ABX08610.1 Hypothetical protein P9211_06791 [Prochlorococcus marinus str. MIT 9211]